LAQAKPLLRAGNLPSWPEPVPRSGAGISIFERKGRFGHSVLALLAGAASALGFEPYGLWPITLLALSWMVHSTMTSVSWVSAWRRSWLFGFAHFSVGLSWLPTAFAYQDGIPQASSWPALGLLAAYLAIYPAFALAAGRLIGTRHPLRIALVAAASWIIAEWLRGTLLTGFPWNPLGIIWLDVPHVPMTAALIGATGLSGLTVLLAGSLALAASRRLTQASISLVLAAVPIAIGYSVAPAGASAWSNVRATVVQPNIPQIEKWRPELAERNLNAHIALSGRPGTAAVPRMLFWPEAAVPYPLETNPALRRRLASLLGPRDLLLTGGTASAAKGDGTTSPTNSVFILNSSGEILFRYDKAHLVPFGEYLPLETLLSRLGLGLFVQGSEGFAAGAGPDTLALPGLPSVGAAICYEMVFPGQVADRAERPSFLFNPSNDAWFGRAGPPQHLAHARMRSIEEGLPTVRSTTSGISAIIAPNGRVLQALADRQSGRIEAELPRPYPLTVFGQIGISTTLVLALVIALLAAVGWLRGRNEGARAAT
jgi:apolipoprotein N-acyltransferase